MKLGTTRHDTATGRTIFLRISSHFSGSAVRQLQLREVVELLLGLYSSLGNATRTQIAADDQRRRSRIYEFLVIQEHELSQFLFIFRRVDNDNLVGLRVERRRRSLRITTRDRAVPEPEQSLPSTLPSESLCPGTSVHCGDPAPGA